MTPAKELAWILHERSVYTYDGAMCNDGSKSSSQGRGTCSWHDGVDYYFYEGQYRITYEECLKKARQISWID
jgi:hypothetical protein